VMPRSLCTAAGATDTAPETSRSGIAGRLLGQPEKPDTVALGGYRNSAEDTDTRGASDPAARHVQPAFLAIFRGGSATQQLWRLSGGSKMMERSCSGPSATTRAVEPTVSGAGRAARRRRYAGCLEEGPCGARLHVARP